MYIVNTTFIVRPTVHGAWYKFMVEKFLPAVEAISVYGSFRFTRLLSDQEEKHFTYSLQIDCCDIPAYQNYMGVTLVEYSDFAKSLFDAEVVHFVSLLKIIEETKK